jgi:hypothetical protein
MFKAMARRTHILHGCKAGLGAELIKKGVREGDWEGTVVGGIETEGETPPKHMVLLSVDVPLR